MTEDCDITLPKWFDWVITEFEEHKWDFSRFIPDLVIICLGLNDYSGYHGWEGLVSEENAEDFRATYHAFIATLRQVYPGIKVLALAS